MRSGHRLKHNAKTYCIPVLSFTVDKENTCCAGGDLLTVSAQTVNNLPCLTGNRYGRRTCKNIFRVIMIAFFF
jgi:hypothetical protein